MKITLISARFHRTPEVVQKETEVKRLHLQLTNAYIPGMEKEKRDKQTKPKFSDEPKSLFFSKQCEMGYP